MTDLLGEWTALGERKRARVTKAITTKLVTEELASNAHYRDSGGTPRVQIYAASREGEQVTALFVVDFYLYCSTISGFDWAEHFIRSGRAVVGPQGPPTVEFAQDHSLGVSELEAEHYEGARLVREICAEKIAELSGTPSTSSPARERELERVRAIVEANAREANRARRRARPP